MVHRLVARADMAGIDASRQRLHTLAFARHGEAGDVGAERFMAIAMAEVPATCST